MTDMKHKYNEHILMEGFGHSPGLHSPGLLVEGGGGNHNCAHAHHSKC